MKKIAYSKINLTLEILGTKRGDGFHDISSVMHKIPLGDEIKLDVSLSGEGKTELVCSDKGLCDIEDNLAYKASQLYLEEYFNATGNKADVKIELNKKTPSGAGLGGGSADAACVLDMLYTMLGKVSKEKTELLASRLGSDVVFCLDRYKSAVCTGRGEICRNIEVLPKNIFLAVLKPYKSIDTRGIYKEYDSLYGDDYSKTETLAMEKALKDGRTDKICSLLMNDFQPICEKRLQEIALLCENLRKQGAVGSLMSGSGSAVYGIFTEEALCRDGVKKTEKEYNINSFVFTPEDFEKMYCGE